MDTPESNAILKKLIAAVERVGHYLEILRQDFNRQSNAVRTTHERSREQRNVRPTWVDPILAKYDQAEGNHEKRDNRQYAVQNSLRWATWCAFGAAVVYAGLTYRMLCAVQEQTRMQREAAIDTERAWLGIDGGIVSAPVTYPDGPEKPVFKLQYTLKNVGRSAAYVTVYGKIFSPKFGEWRDAQGDFCQPIFDNARRVGRRWGKGAYTIIPGVDLPFNLSYDGTQENAVPLIIDAPQTIVPKNIGCILYKSMTDDGVRMTTFVADISTSAGQSGKAQPVRLDGSEIPSNELRVLDIRTIDAR